MNSACVFCKIAAQEIKAPLLIDEPDLVAFRDGHPQAPKHLLVIPRRHVADLAALSAEEDGALLGRLLQAANRVAQSEGLGQGGYRVVLNTGPDAGQSVFHIHLHVLGGRPLGWPPG